MLLYHLVITSIVVSMLAHPFLIAIAIYEWVRLIDGTRDPITLTIAGVCVFNLVGGYSTWIFFAKAILAKQGVNASWPLLISLPIYWLLISLAGWRALVQLVVSPHRWEKTPHGLAKRRDFANITGNQWHQ
jgi:hypothetical protein